jgi:serine/threonine protein phosphatase PrpC
MSADQSLDHLKNNLQVNIGQFSSAGIKPANEDAIGIRIPEGNLLLNKGIVSVIADGVSASEGGQVASSAAVTGFLSDYYSTHDTWSVETSGLKVLTALNRWLYGLGMSLLDPEKGYITTLSTVILKSASAYIFHVGDSRIYRLRDGSLEQITRDHSKVVGKGQRYLARAMGIDVHLDIDYHHLDLRQDDLFVLVTDGVYEFVSDRELFKAVSVAVGPEAVTGDMLETICQQVVNEALEKGSDDNLSVQLLHVEHPGEAIRNDVLASVSQLPFPPALRTGMVIDDWRIVSEIHASSRSEVYQVENKHSGQRAVLKAPSANFDDDPAYIERFLLEEWVGNRISSSHVISVIPSPNKSFLYYLTEYIQGPTLGQLIRERSQLAVEDAQNIMSLVISGLRAFHRRDVLHQDIKPDNIIYSRNAVKIIDFGSCLISSLGEIKTRINQENKLGTRDYCAPEYLLNAPVSVKSDQFSLGVLLYEMVTGKLPFGDDYRKCESAKDFSKLVYTPSYEWNALVPVWLDSAIQRTLSIDPDDRYPALTELALDIQRPNPAFDGKIRRRMSKDTSVLVLKGLVILLLLTNIVTLLVK